MDGAGNSDIPEVPNKYRVHLAQYAAAQVLIADGSIEDAKLLMSMFDQGYKRYKESSMYSNRVGFKSVTKIVDY
jgi:hypothetical protein